MLEIHPVDRRDQCRREKDHRSDREALDDRVLFDADQAERGVEQEGDLLRKEAGVVEQRADVLGKGFYSLPKLLRTFALCGDVT